MSQMKIGSELEQGFRVQPQTIRSETSHMSKLIAYVGTYGTGVPLSGGGIVVLEVSQDGRSLKQISRTDTPQAAGYLLAASNSRTLYVVDERKTDGRGPVEPPAAVHAFSFDANTGGLTWLNSQRSPGPRPTFLALEERKGLLASANHGDFDHVEHVLKHPDGSWSIEYLYDDSTVVLYRLAASGKIDSVAAVEVLKGHGMDPNGSPQVAGHGQASAHAHSVVFDPSGRYLLVCDKGTDRIFTFFADTRLRLASTFKFPDQTGPRHLRFDQVTGHAVLTCEFSSEIASLSFDVASGGIHVLDKRSTVAADFKGKNEPADIRMHPNGHFAYVNNRGEDCVAWFWIAESGQLSRQGQIQLAKSANPGVAARSFSIAPSGEFMLVSDRPANRVRAYLIDGSDGSLSEIGGVDVSNPAYIEFVSLGI